MKIPRSTRADGKRARIGVRVAARVVVLAALSTAAIASVGAESTSTSTSTSTPSQAQAQAQAQAPAGAARGALQTFEVVPARSARWASYDGIIEAVRQTVVASQVAGAVVALQVRPGDDVKAGQVMLRLDARAAEQQAGAAAAQLKAAQAAQAAATTEFERQQQLFQKNYISRAALERAQAQYKAASAQSAAQAAAAGAARTATGYYLVKAPYDGLVADVPVVLGDMAMPGRALVTLYDPAALRVSVPLPESVAQRLRADAVPPPTIQLSSASGERVAPLRWELLPSADPVTHTVTLRAALPPGVKASPGQFARVWLAGAAGDVDRIMVPSKAVVRRGELNGVYVIDAEGKPLLRQVRLGMASGDQVEVLTGLGAGERVALDPEAAGRVK